jgi:hypothetical protein
LITSFAKPILSNFAKFYQVLPMLVKTWQNDVSLKNISDQCFDGDHGQDNINPPLYWYQPKKFASTKYPMLSSMPKELYK